MSKRTISLILGIAMLVMLLAACAPATPAPTPAPAAEPSKATESAPTEQPKAAEPEKPAEKKLVIGEVIFNMNQPYQQAHAAQFESYCKSIGVEPIVVDGKSDAQVIANGIDDLISKGVDGIIVQPLDGASINVSIDAAQKAGIPIVTFFNKATIATNPHVRLAEDVTAFELGEFVANKWLELYPDKKPVVGVIDEVAAEYTHVVRAMKFVEGVQKVVPDCEYTMVDGKGVRDTAYSVAEDLLQSHKNVNIVYGINADSALGALAAFQAAGRGKAADGLPATEIFVSIDGTEGEILEMVNPDSPLKACMALSPRNNSKILVDTLMKTINGEFKIDQDITIDAPDIILDYWNKSFDELQTFLKDEYLSSMDLRKELDSLK